MRIKKDIVTQKLSTVCKQFITEEYAKFLMMDEGDKQNV